jgi:hypothetical protein
MISYRIYHLDDANHIAGVTERECPNDQEALAAARQLAGPDAPVEVWQRARCLGKVQV